MSIHLPRLVRYVKCGRGGQWWDASRNRNQVHFGWNSISGDLLRRRNYDRIERIIRKAYGNRNGATQDFNAIREVLDSPSRFLWMTFEEGCLWWCTVKDGAHPNPLGESATLGNFWLQCKHRWSNHSLGGRRLSRADLPGVITRTAGFKGTLCEPEGWEQILRIIRDEKDADAIRSARARADYQDAILTLVKRLRWKDFEQLVDMMLARTGWVRTGTLGGVTEGIDLEVENFAVSERAFVQVKSSASQAIFDAYIKRFESERDKYARMIFAVHTTPSPLQVPRRAKAVQLWDGERVSEMVVRLGLGEWVEHKAS